MGWLTLVLAALEALPRLIKAAGEIVDAIDKTEGVPTTPEMTKEFVNFAMEAAVEVRNGSAARDGEDDSEEIEVVRALNIKVVEMVFYLKHNSGGPLWKP